MPGRLLGGLALLAIGLAVPSAASAEIACTHSGPPENTVTFATDELEESLELERVGDEIRLRSEHLNPVRRKGKRFKLKRVRTTAVCAPIVPTVLNTDRIVIAPVTESETEIEISLQGGPFAPGATPEAGGGAEIEIEIQTGSFDGARFVGSEGNDLMRFGTVGRATGVNLNPASEGVADVDATVEPVAPDLPPGVRLPESILEEVPPVGALGRGGDDTITTGGGPEFGAAFAGSAAFNGNEGDDTIIATSVHQAEIKGGQGADTIHAARRFSVIYGGNGGDAVFGQDRREFVLLGPGRDFADLAGGKDAVLSLDRRTDRVRCGPKRDLVIKDRKDRLQGCERQLKRLPRPERRGD